MGWLVGDTVGPSVGADINTTANSFAWSTMDSSLTLSNNATSMSPATTTIKLFAFILSHLTYLSLCHSLSISQSYNITGLTCIIEVPFRRRRPSGSILNQTCAELLVRQLQQYQLGVVRPMVLMEFASTVSQAERHVSKSVRDLG